MVLQKNVLFSGSIYDNIRWGDEHASEEEIRRVCKLAHACLLYTSFGIYIIARNFRSYSRGRVWAEPTKVNNHDALLVMQKNRK